MSAHTPGPWAAAVGSAVNAQYQPIIHAQGRDIACVFGTGFEDYANAALMSAAPDMLAALKALADITHDLHEPDGSPDSHIEAANAAARAAIAKAEPE